MAPSRLMQHSAWPAVLRWVRAAFPEVQQLSAQELRRRLETGDPPVLLDTRDEAEYAVSHLRGAQRFDADLGDTDLKRRWLPGTPIVTYCSIGYRSSAVARRLTALGFTDVCNLEGSIFHWANEGGEVVRDGQPVREVHEYSRTWGLLLRPELRARGTF